MTVYGRRRPASLPAGWAVWVLLGIAAIPFLLAWLSGEIRQFMIFDLALLGKEGFVRPWTLITYIFADTGNGANAIFVAFLCYWIYMIGRSLEKDLGAGLLLGIFAGATLLHGLLAAIAGTFVPANGLIGIGMPEAFLSIVWCGRNQGEVIKMFGVIPIQGRWLALLIAIISLLGTGNGAPAFGFIVCLPFVLAWFYGSGKLAFAYGRVKKVKPSKNEQREFDKFITNVRDREKEREERERLRKLFEDSVSSDDDDKR